MKRRAALLGETWCGDEAQTGTKGGLVDMDDKGPDRRPISLSESAVWDEQLDAFRVKVQGNRDVSGVVILRWARLPIAHLDASKPQKHTRLGQILRERLEVEVNAAITRGDRTMSEGLALLGKEDEAKG